MNNLKNRCQKELKELKEQCKKTSFIIGKHVNYIDYMEVNKLYYEIKEKLDILLSLTDKMNNFQE